MNVNAVSFLGSCRVNQSRAECWSPVKYSMELYIDSSISI